MEKRGLFSIPFLCCCCRKGRCRKVERKKKSCVLKGWRVEKLPNQPYIPYKRKKKMEEIPQTCTEISIIHCTTNKPRKTYNGNSYCIECISSAL